MEWINAGMLFIAGYLTVSVIFATAYPLKFWMIVAYRRFGQQSYELYRETLSDRHSSPKRIEEIRAETHECFASADQVIEAYLAMSRYSWIMPAWPLYAAIALVFELNRKIQYWRLRLARKVRTDREKLRV